MARIRDQALLTVAAGRQGVHHRVEVAAELPQLVISVVAKRHQLVGLGHPGQRCGKFAQRTGDQATGQVGG